MSENVIKSKPEKIILKQLVEVKKVREGHTLILTHKQWINYREIIATLIIFKEEITVLHRCTQKNVYAYTCAGDQMHSVHLKDAQTESFYLLAVTTFFDNNNKPVLLKFA